MITTLYHVMSIQEPSALLFTILFTGIQLLPISVVAHEQQPPDSMTAETTSLPLVSFFDATSKF
jgi:hypothetical protein